MDCGSVSLIRPTLPTQEFPGIRMMQETFAEYLSHSLGWDSVYAYKTETFGPQGTLGWVSEREVVLVCDLRAALTRLNPEGYVGNMY